MIRRILLYSFFAFAVAYLVWHLGRFYEFRRIVNQATPAWYLTDPKIVDPIVNVFNDRYVTGEWYIGLCLPNLPMGLDS